MANKSFTKDILTGYVAVRSTTERSGEWFVDMEAAVSRSPTRVTS